MTAPHATSLAPVAPANHEVAPYDPSAGSEWTSNDVAIPYLSLAQRTGKLAEDRPEWLGKWIFDKETCLGDTVNLVVLSMRKYYIEDLPFESTEIPRKFNRAEDARAANCPVQDIADIDLLVELPSDAAEKLGQVEFEGRVFAPARYTARSSAYGATVKIIRRDLSAWLKGDYASGFYSMKAVKKVSGKNSWFAPNLSPNGKVTAELRDLIRAQFSH